MNYTAVFLVIMATLALALVGMMVGKQLEYLKIFGLNTLSMVDSVDYNPINFIKEMSKENIVRFRLNSWTGWMDFSGQGETKICRIAFKMPNMMICYQYYVDQNRTKIGEFAMKKADGSPAPLRLLNTVSTTTLTLKVWRVDTDDMQAKNLKNATEMQADRPVPKGSLVIDVSLAGTVQAQIPIIIPLINNGSEPPKPNDFWWRLITPHDLCIIGEDDF